MNFITPKAVYIFQKNNDMANLFKAMNELKNTSWFINSVRDIRAFRVEDWSDFTDFMKG